MAAKILEVTSVCINVQVCNIQIQFCYILSIIFNSEHILEGTLTKCNFHREQAGWWKWYPMKNSWKSQVFISKGKENCRERGVEDRITI